MKREQWSGYEKFIIMMDNSKAKGVRRDYPAYLDYKVLLSVLQNIRKGQHPDSYYHDGKLIDLKLKRSSVEKFTDKIEQGMWSEELRTMANVLGLGMLLCPYPSGNWIPVESSKLD